MGRLIFIFFMTFIVNLSKAQTNPIKVEYSANSNIKKDFVRNVDNYITILSLSDFEFEKYCKLDGFSTVTENDWCIVAFAGQVLSMDEYFDALKKCGNKIVELWHGPVSSSGYRPLISELEKYFVGTNSDGARVYGLKFEGYSYTFTLSRQSKDGRYHETLKAERVKVN